MGDYFRTCIGMVLNDGVLLACENPTTSKLIKKGANHRINIVDHEFALLSAGFTADSRHIANRAREEAASFRENFEDNIPSSVLAERLSLYIQAHTLYSSVRPFGVVTILANSEKLYMIDPSGSTYSYHATSIGKGRQVARTELEKLSLSRLSFDEAVYEAIRIILISRDETFRDNELELLWIPKNKPLHFVPKNVIDSAEARARQFLLSTM